MTRSGGTLGVPSFTVIEAMFTIRPLPWAFMVGDTAREHSQVPLTFTLKHRSHSSGGRSSIGARVAAM